MNRLRLVPLGGTARGFAALASVVFACCAVPLQAHPLFVSSFLGYPSGLYGAPVVAADFDGDGHPDVAIAGPGQVLLRRNAGDGSLLGPVSWPAGSGQFIAAADLDSDGAMDLVTQYDSLGVAVLLGGGDGSFGTPTRFACEKAPTAAALGQLDADPTPDLVTVNPKSGSVSVFLGNGDGSFAPRTDHPVSPAPIALSLADFDGDGDRDVLVLCGPPADVVLLANDGSGQLTTIGTLPTISGAYAIVAAPFDGDALPDFAVVSYGSAALAVHLATGPGAFAGPLTRVLPDAPVQVLAADLDGDGAVDLLAGSHNESGLMSLLGNGDGTFEDPRTFHCPRGPWSFAVADMNGGGKPDAIVATSLGSLGVLFGNGDGTFGGLADHPVGLFPWGVAAGDFDEDGHVDLVASNTGDHSLSVLRGLGGGDFAPRTDHPTGLSPRDVVTADVDGDAHLDLVVANNGPGTQTSSTISVLLGDGAGGFAPRADYAVGRWPSAVAVGDVNGDGRPDVAVAEGDFAGNLSILYGQGGGVFGGRQGFLLGSNATDVAIGDVTGDGHADVVLADYSGRGVTVLPGHGDGTWAGHFTLDAGDYPMSVAIADVTGDGVADLVVGSGVVSVFPGVGAGAFGARADYACRGGSVLVGDFDADGGLDVAAASGRNSNTISLLLHQPGGGLAPAVDLGAGDDPLSVTAADFDLDGRPDLAAANRYGKSISVLLNTGGYPWSRWLDVPASGAPSALRLAVHPNPAPGVIAVDFTLPAAADVTVRVYDLAGRRLATLASGRFAAGPHSVAWDRDAPADRGAPGVCFVELASGAARVVRRVVLLR